MLSIGRLGTNDLDRARKFSDADPPRPAVGGIGCPNDIRSIVQAGARQPGII